MFGYLNIKQGIGGKNKKHGQARRRRDHAEQVDWELRSLQEGLLGLLSVIQFWPKGRSAPDVFLPLGCNETSIRGSLRYAAGFM